MPFGRIPPERRSATYESVLREISRRIRYVHCRMRERGDILPEAMPDDRDLSDLEVEELAWRVYSLSCITRTSLVRCMPNLMLLAAEWLSSTEPDVWDAYCEMSLS